MTVDHDDTGQVRRDLSASAESIVHEIDSLLGGLSPRERDIAQVTADVVTAYVAQVPRLRAPDARVTALEIAKRENDERWLRLVGAAESNGRLGRMTAEVAALRADIGTPDQARATREAVDLVRGVRRKLLAAVGAALLAIGGSAWGLISATSDAHAAASAAAARTDARLDMIEAILIGRRLGTAATPDP